MESQIFLDSDSSENDTSQDVPESGSRESPEYSRKNPVQVAGRFCRGALRNQFKSR